MDGPKITYVIEIQNQAQNKRKNKIWTNFWGPQFYFIFKMGVFKKLK